MRPARAVLASHPAGHPLAWQQQLALVLSHEFQVVLQPRAGWIKARQPQRRIVGHEYLDRLEPRQFTLGFGRGALADELGTAELAGAQVGVGQATRPPSAISAVR